MPETLLCPLRCPVMCEWAEQKQTEKHLQQNSEKNNTSFPCPSQLTPKPKSLLDERHTVTSNRWRLRDEKGIFTIFKVKPVEVHPFYQITQSFRFKRRKAWITDFSMEKMKFCNEHMWLGDHNFGEIILFLSFLSNISRTHAITLEKNRTEHKEKAWSSVSAPSVNLAAYFKWSAFHINHDLNKKSPKRDCYYK